MENDTDITHFIPEVLYGDGVSWIQYYSPSHLLSRRLAMIIHFKLQAMEGDISLLNSQTLHCLS